MKNLVKVLVGAALAMSVSVAAHAVDDDTFASWMAWAEQPRNDYTVIERLGEIYVRGDITAGQKAKALWTRAVYRCTTGDQKLQCIEDYQAFLRDYPDHKYAKDAPGRIEYAQTQMSYINKRLAGNQTMADRFADLWQSGRWADAIAFLKEKESLVKGPTFSSVYVNKLIDAEYLCQVSTDAETTEYFVSLLDTTYGAYDWCENVKPQTGKGGG